MPTEGCFCHWKNGRRCRTWRFNVNIAVLFTALLRHPTEPLQGVVSQDDFLPLPQWIAPDWLKHVEVGQECSQPWVPSSEATFVCFLSFDSPLPWHLASFFIYSELLHTPVIVAI